MEPSKIDYSISDTYYTCPRKYQLRYVNRVTSVYGSTAMRFGSCFHAAMEGFYSYVRDNGWQKDGKAVEQGINFAKAEWEKESEGFSFNEDYRTFPNLLDLFLKYLDHFYQDEVMLNVRYSERAFKLLMKPTKEDLTYYPWLKPFFFTGKIDQECQLNGMNWINEFKTTGWSLSKLRDELTRSPQIIGYNYASKHCCDVRPEGSLVTIAYCLSRKSRVTGNYGKLSIDFGRYPQIFNDYDLQDWRRHFISLVAQMQWSEEHDYYPPRFQNCFRYGRCEFLNLCEQGRPLKSCSYHGYQKGKIWDVTTEVPNGAVVEAEEKI